MQIDSERAFICLDRRQLYGFSKFFVDNDGRRTTGPFWIQVVKDRIKFFKELKRK